MKRAIIFILAVLLIVPSFATAVTGNSPYFGKWVGQKHGSTGTYSTILYYLNITKYTTCSYFEICINEGGSLTRGSIPDYKAFDGNWEIINDDHLSIPTSGISAIEVYYDKETDTLYTSEWPKITFSRIP